MSVQFGKWNRDGKPIDPKELEEVRPALAPYGPDGEGYICRGNLAVLYRAFHTTKESGREKQPFITKSGCVITWDGRLDNREELINRLKCELSLNSTDLEIAATAYEQWERNSFAELIGDWAVSVWNPSDQSLILAKDFVGTRHLYYSVQKDHVTWCTILDPLVLFAGRSFELEEEYIAGWLSFFPAAHLTPYAGIEAVPPSSYVRIAPGGHKVERYWDFDPATKIRYRTDAEYEEHFRSAFSKSVQRRLRSDRPILAELSGGVDSSSIVCVSDRLMSCGLAETPRLDTVSYYDDLEPNWDERPLFTKLEKERGRTGCHIDVSGETSLDFIVGQQFAATPASLCRCSQQETAFAQCIRAQDDRILLSGIGGDEVTGGHPSPTSELADLLVSLQLRTLIHQLKAWSINNRKPWFHLLGGTAKDFFPLVRTRSSTGLSLESVLRPDFLRRHKGALLGYPKRLRCFGPLPSFQDNLSTLNMLQRQLASSALSKDPLFEVRYPYLDRSFLEFLFSIPRNQLLRPGQRRSLMRRALRGVVPDEVLNRRRKAYSVRTPSTIIEGEGGRLLRKSSFRSALLGIVDPKLFSTAVENVRLGHDL